MTKTERQIMVSWHIGVTGKQLPHGDRERKLYNVEWRRQVGKLKKRKRPNDQAQP